MGFEEDVFWEDGGVGGEVEDVIDGGGGRYGGVIFELGGGVGDGDGYFMGGIEEEMMVVVVGGGGGWDFEKEVGVGGGCYGYGGGREEGRRRWFFGRKGKMCKKMKLLDNL